MTRPAPRQPRSRRRRSCPWPTGRTPGWW
jgi:hypothetical protein